MQPQMEGPSAAVVNWLEGKLLSYDKLSVQGEVITQSQDVLSSSALKGCEWL